MGQIQSVYPQPAFSQGWTQEAALDPVDPSAKGAGISDDFSAELPARGRCCLPPPAHFQPVGELCHGLCAQPGGQNLTEGHSQAWAERAMVNSSATAEMIGST